MQVCVLGPLTIGAEGGPVDIGGARLRSLLVRLSADAGAWVPVSRLVQSLWLEDPPADEVNALQSLVSRLRRALPRPDLVESGPAGYRLVITKDDVDALAFENLVGQGRRAASPEATVEVLGRALVLWRGAPLTEVADAPYAQAWTERLERLRLTAIDERAAALLTLGRAGDPVAELEEIATAHPLRERTHELLIRALAAAGRQGEALAVYERLRRAMADELGLDPPAALQELQGQVLRDDLVLRSSAADPLKTGTRRTNLRVALTTFVGREAELDGITAQLRQARLVTLVGTGGAGKTRLVTEVASRLDGRDGVWMVELAPVMDPDDVPSTVLGAIGSVDRSQLETAAVQQAKQSAPRDVRTRLVETLSASDAVIVLDNCEHLIEACAEIAEFLLARCPRLTVLATSREPLSIVGESIWSVRPLATQTEDAPAVRLFADRAALVRPGFRVTPENAEAVHEICRRLDGLPLAIELAAARLRTLAPEALAGRLDNRFRLLTGGNRTAMPRHQTLRAVVAWSWELLTDEERDLVERLAVFPGGATARTASAVCREVVDRPDDFDEDTVADLLLSLADKSLLVSVDGAQPRYRLLETIREYALERLSERGEMASMRRAHAEFFLRLAETAEPHLRSAEQLGWLQQLISERDNLLASLRFAVDTEDAAHAHRLVAALGWFWTMTTRHEEGGSWAAQALRVPGESPPQARLFALVLNMLSTSMGQERLPTPEQLVEIEEIANRLDVHRSHPMISFIRPALAAFRENMTAGREIAVQVMRDHPDPWARAMLRLMNAVFAENAGDFSITEEMAPAALAEFEAIGDRWGIATAGSQLAEVRRVHGDLDGAIELLALARKMMSELVVTDDEAHALVRIARMRRENGDLEGAWNDLTEALAIADLTGSPMSIAMVLSGQAALAAATGNYAEARQLTERAMARMFTSPQVIPQLRSTLLGELAVYELADDLREPARRHLVESVAEAVRSGDMPVLARVMLWQAQYLAVVGDFTGAAEILGAASVVRGHNSLLEPDIARVTQLVRDGIEPVRFTKVFDDAAALPRPEAVELAETVAGRLT
ncbi:BTAD domain-containing putative transcriptional regulator [Kineosporia succinea]|uniref:ATPase/DNA-binding SARP family transcriptional activator n=1 Tax=Kineosporia succinea TaxID=84632 RepID=A0ABT9P0V1_9ACTN|nr:BTAD domain-containing putative transcriptional regulator [Kineosporia succinea]MDP9826298.1 putative ATPase/DNA-binding SARP family transcriptional activator [Kineosporia succinea]